MTQREFFNAVIANTNSAELVEYAKAALEKLDNRNEKRASKPSKTAIANEPIIKAIAEQLATKTEPTTSPEIAGLVGITIQKASSLLVQMEKAGKVTSTEVKVPKKGKLKGYTLVK